MKEKAKELPMELGKALQSGNVEKAKEIFSQCDPNATFVSSNVFSLHPMPKEFAFWAKEQGADINFRDRYGRTPIFIIVRRDEDIKLMVELGADVNVTLWDGVTPLHYAAQQGRKKAAKDLLAAGVDVNVRTKEYNGFCGFTPLEKTLYAHSLSSQKKLEMSKLFLKQGAVITDRSRQLVQAFSSAFYRHNQTKEDMPSIQKQAEAMEKLCSLFGVEPVRDGVHDGVSPIVVTYFGSSKGSFDELWDYLVPPQGRAKSAQGEVIRLTGRIQDELMRNGGMNWENWDGDYRKMLYTLPRYFQYGHPLGETDMNSVTEAVEGLKDGDVNEQQISNLCGHAELWISENPEAMPLLEADYLG